MRATRNREYGVTRIGGSNPSSSANICVLKLPNIKMNFFISLGYLGLFIASFGAATVLPISSEPIFISLIIAKFNPFACLIIASIGNWLGGMINYYIGRLGKTEWIEKYLKINHSKITNFQQKLHNKSSFMAFFCFLPAVGDIIGFALGFMRANILIVNISMFLGKLFRYIILLYAFKHGIQYLLP